MLIRPAVPSDKARLILLYQKAFKEERLEDLVTDLLAYAPEVSSFVAESDELLGHVAVSRCNVSGCAGAVYLLGPLAVSPSHQRQGIGQGLVNTAVNYAFDSGTNRVCVLGDPAYYGRLGFSSEQGISPAYPLPQEWSTAWQSRVNCCAGEISGELLVPKPWKSQSLWS